MANLEFCIMKRVCYKTGRLLSLNSCFWEVEGGGEVSGV